jgi:hypothetical protein
MIKKRTFFSFLLIIVVVLLLEVLRLSPLARTGSYVSLILSTYGHVIFFKNNKSFTTSFKRWYFLGLLLMLISIITTYVHYGQSFVSGFVANIKLYEVGLVSLFWYFFLKYKIPISNFFSLLTISGWITVIIIALMIITNFTYINESDLTGNIIEIHGGKLSKGLVNFIAIYFFSIFLFKNNIKYLFFSILFFSSNHFYEVQRYALISSILLYAIGIFKNNNYKANFRLKMFTFLIIFILFIINISSNVGVELIRRFQSAFKIFSTTSASKIGDSSVIARINEIQFAIERFSMHPFFGNGNFRVSESQKVIGDVYFHLSDIGFFGILYSFGILGLLVFVTQLIYLLKNLKVKPSNIFQIFSILVLSYMMITSLLTGESIIFYKKFMFYVCLTELFRYNYHKKKTS